MTVELEHDMDVKEMLKENLELTREIHSMTTKIRHHIFFQKVVSLIYLVLIVAPIVLSIIYLPPLLKNVFGQYESLLGPMTGGSLLDTLKTGLGGVDLNAIQEGVKTGNIDPALLKNIDMNKLTPEQLKLIQQLQKK